MHRLRAKSLNLGYLGSYYPAPAGSDTQHERLRIRRNETTSGLFPAEARKSRPWGEACRCRNTQIVEPGTAEEDKKHETSLEWRRNRRGVRDCRTGVGAERPHDPGLAAGEIRTGSKGRRLCPSQGVDGDAEKADAPYGPPPGRRHGQRRRPDDRRTQPSGARPPQRRRRADAPVWRSGPDGRQRPDERCGWTFRPVGRWHLGSASAAVKVSSRAICWRRITRGLRPPCLFSATRIVERVLRRSSFRIDQKPHNPPWLSSKLR